EIQPSRHRLTLPLGEGATDETVLAGISKSTRQRIRKAEREQITVVRHDARASAGVGDGFRPPAESSSVALDRFYDLLLDTAERRHFSFGPRGDFVAWWSRALAAGHLVYLEARAGGPHGDPLAGLVLYRHGGRLSTVHSGDLEVSRRTHPGALHLLRWRAIELAIHEGCTEMDLGGVDVAGARREPAEGEPMYGLYQHKLSFGARWLALSGAHERVIRPNRYRAGTLLSRATRIGEIAVSRIAR
ncbi:MAG TPA: GNAT family N-acetyltransferase, partial [Candidatus Limnocylindrales bacterium]|nr:GNAT family N-acetyltransferase [Candidatus Limnocylindrales bacterium]